MEDPKQNGYLPIRVMIPIGQPNGGTFSDLWQKVEDGIQTKVVTAELVEVTVPEIHEAIPRANELHFAPNVPNDPRKFQPAPMAEFQAAIAKGSDTQEYRDFVAKEQARLATFDPAVKGG